MTRESSRAYIDGNKLSAWPPRNVRRRSRNPTSNQSRHKEPLLGGRLYPGAFCKRCSRQRRNSSGTSHRSAHSKSRMNSAPTAITRPLQKLSSFSRGLPRTPIRGERFSGRNVHPERPSGSFPAQRGKCPKDKGGRSQACRLNPLQFPPLIIKGEGFARVSHSRE